MRPDQGVELQLQADVELILQYPGRKICWVELGLDRREQGGAVCIEGVAIRQIPGPEVVALVGEDEFYLAASWDFLIPFLGKTYILDG